MTNENSKVIYVLDLLHLIEKKLGDSRIEKMSVKEIIELRNDAKALSEGELAADEFEKKWVY